MQEVIVSWCSKTGRVSGICYSLRGHVFIFFHPRCSEKKCAHLLIYNVEFITGKRAVALDPYIISHAAFSFLKHSCAKASGSLEMCSAMFKHQFSFLCLYMEYGQANNESFLAGKCILRQQYSLRAISYLASIHLVYCSILTYLCMFLCL